MADLTCENVKIIPMDFKIEILFENSTIILYTKLYIFVIVNCN